MLLIHTQQKTLCVCAIHSRVYQICNIPSVGNRTLLAGRLFFGCRPIVYLTDHFESSWLTTLLLTGCTEYSVHSVTNGMFVVKVYVHMSLHCHTASPILTKHHLNELYLLQ